MRAVDRPGTTGYKAMVASVLREEAGFTVEQAWQLADSTSLTDACWLAAIARGEAA